MSLSVTLNCIGNQFIEMLKEKLNEAQQGDRASVWKPTPQEEPIHDLQIIFPLTCEFMLQS
jgi:hypothetical protein